MPAVAQTVSLVKMNGTGNDFVLLDERPRRFEQYQEMARALCDRDGPLGADGLLVVLRPSQHEPEEVAASMRIFNADGSEAEMCGNGIRCVARYLWGRSEGGVRLTLETPAGPVVANVEATSPEFRVRVDIGTPLIRRRYADGASIEFGGTAWRYAEVSIGNVHAVIFVEDVEAIDLERMGAAVSADPRFARGANVHVAHAVDHRTIRARVFERGVGITRACGSGAVAIAAAAIDDGRASSPLRVHLPGGVLDVEWQTGERAFLSGPVEVEFERTVLL